MNSLRSIATLLLAAASGTAALAQAPHWSMPAPVLQDLQYNRWLTQYRFDRQLENQGNSRAQPRAGLTGTGLGGGLGSGRSALPSTALGPASARGTTAIAQLASGYPRESRPEAERVFREMLAGYGKIERQFGIPRRDLGGAVAAFLAGSWMAYRNADFPDEYFKPLVEQMQRMIAGNPEFAAVPEGDRQYTFDQFATLGMFMATTQMALKERPDARITANMQRAGKGYLEQLLKTDADRVQITAQGLVLK